MAKGGPLLEVSRGICGIEGLGSKGTARDT